MPNFGPYLKNVRESKPMSINQLAALSGVSAPQISRVETGTRGVPKPDTIRKLADALNVSYEGMMEAAGYFSEEKSSPDWASSKDKRDFKKMLEEDGEIMFDGIPISGDDKEKIKKIMEAMFWDAKKQNKRKPIGK
ncbi:helix-turn-helix domain-containing protein [Paenibacillus sp. GCM10027627]|uniref:helix-turn-helix domain-containing protein n=1 Tax=unclassified Paenibacillus TaxID=185978 RepID=UPI00362AE293